MHGGKNRDAPIGQFVLIGNFRRRLARELLVLLYTFELSNPLRKSMTWFWRASWLPRELDVTPAQTNECIGGEWTGDLV